MQSLVTVNKQLVIKKSYAIVNGSYRAIINFFLQATYCCSQNQLTIYVWNLICSFISSYNISAENILSAIRCTDKQQISIRVFQRLLIIMQEIAQVPNLFLHLMYLMKEQVYYILLIVLGRENKATSDEQAKFMLR